MNQWNGYQILLQVGQGGHGTIYLAQETSTKKEVALKILSLNISEQGKKDLQYEEEILSLSGNEDHFLMSSFNKLQSSCGNQIAFILPYIPSQMLYQSLQSHGPFCEEWIRYYLICMLDAINHLHGKGYVHRDLKSGNIILDANGHVHIIDYGVSYPISTLNMKRQCGTEYIRAPEMLRGEEYGAAIDFWALGVVMFEMATGKPPWSYQATAQDILKTNVVALAEHDVFSKEMRTVLLGLLESDPNKRNSQASTVLAHPWFQHINVHDIRTKTIAPPYRPTLFEWLSDSSESEE